MPARLLQDAQEQGAMFRVAPEVGVDAGAGMPDRTQRRRGHSFQLGAGAQGQECAQDGRRVAIEQIQVEGFQQAAAVAEFRVDRLGNGVVLRKERAFQVLQQDRRQLGDLLGRPEVALHQFLGCAAGIAPPQSERARDLRLEVEDQTVFATSRLDVEHRAHTLEHAVVARARFGVGRQPEPGQVAQVSPKPAARAVHIATCRSRRPPGLLDVRFEAVGRVLELHVALAHFEHLRPEERARIAAFSQSCDQIREQRRACGCRPGSGPPSRWSGW